MNKISVPMLSTIHVISPESVVGYAYRVHVPAISFAWDRRERDAYRQKAIESWKEISNDNTMTEKELQEELQEEWRSLYEE